MTLSIYFATQAIHIELISNLIGAAFYRHFDDSYLGEDIHVILIRITEPIF